MIINSKIYCKITVDSDNCNDTMKSIQQIYRVDRRKIHFLKFIFEAYDGLASMTTVDAGLGIVLLSIPPGCETEVEALLKDLQRDVRIEPYPRRISDLRGGDGIDPQL